MKNLERRFYRTTEELLQILSSLNQEQLNKVPFKDSWTAGQIGDHLWRSYAVVETLNGRVEPTSRPEDEKVPVFEDLFADLSVKMESPKEILPSVETIDKEELISKLTNRISKLTDIITIKELSVICLDYAIPEYGEFTRFEWMAFNTVHTERHVKQLKNIIGKITREKISNN